jgi:hypothetical protein
MRWSQLPFLAMVGFALFFVVLAVLYGVGAILSLKSNGFGHAQEARAMLMAPLATAFLILARLAWPQRSP